MRWPFVLAAGTGVVFRKIHGKVWTTLVPWLELGRKRIPDLSQPNGGRQDLNENGLCYQVGFANSGLRTAGRIWAMATWAMATWALER